jgi:hypothetical protein
MEHVCREGNHKQGREDLKSAGVSILTMYYAESHFLACDTEWLL